MSRRRCGADVGKGGSSGIVTVAVVLVDVVWLDEDFSEVLRVAAPERDVVRPGMVEVVYGCMEIKDGWEDGNSSF